VQNDLKPLLIGQASKSRVTLIQAYITQMERFANQDSVLSILEMLKTVIIDLISGYSSPNNKLRTLSEEVFGRVFDLLTGLNALS
jgi:hypothetical protein